MDPETLPNDERPRDPPQALALEWTDPPRHLGGDRKLSARDGRLRLNVWAHSHAITLNDCPLPDVRWYVSAGDEDDLRRPWIGGEGPADSIVEAQRMAEALASALSELLRLIDPEIEKPEPTTNESER